MALRLHLLFEKIRIIKMVMSRKRAAVFQGRCGVEQSTWLSYQVAAAAGPLKAKMVSYELQCVSSVSSQPRRSQSVAN